MGAAVIGTGFIGTVHVEQLRRIGVQVRGVLGSTPERGAAKAQALGVARAYPSLEALPDDPSVEVVHVTSPNHLHVPQATQILAAGRHVVAVNSNIRSYPLHQQVRELVGDATAESARFGRWAEVARQQVAIGAGDMP